MVDATADRRGRVSARRTAAVRPIRIARSARTVIRAVARWGRPTVAAAIIRRADPRKAKFATSSATAMAATGTVATSAAREAIAIEVTLTAVIATVATSIGEIEGTGAIAIV